MYHSTPLIHPCNLYNRNYNTLMYFEPSIPIIAFLRVCTIYIYVYICLCHLHEYALYT